MAGSKVSKKAVFSALAVVLLGAFTYIYFYLIESPQFALYASHKIQESAKGTLSFHKAELSLFPRVGVIFSDVHYILDLPQTNLDITAKNIEIDFSWLEILSGNFVVANLLLRSPSISIVEYANLIETLNEIVAEEGIAEENINPETATKALSEAIPEVVKSTTISIIDAEIYYTPKGAGQAFYSNHIDLSINGFKNASLQIGNLNSLDALKNQEFLTLFDVTDLRVNIDNIDFNQETVSADISTFVCVNSKDQKLKNTLKSQGKITLLPNFMPAQFTQAVTLNSDFLLPEQKFSALLNFNFNYTDLNDMTITDGLIHIEDNSATFSVIAKNVLTEPKLTTNLDIKKFTLTRWFEFARNLPLAIAGQLNDLSGSLTAEITPNSITSQNIKVQTENGTVFTGNLEYIFTGDSKITVSASTQKIDINTFFPEVVGKTAKELTFKNPPLIESSGGGGQQLSYNVNISVKQASFWKYSFNDLTASIKSGKNGIDIPITIKNFYGGSVFSSVNIEGSTLRTNIDVKNSQISNMLRALQVKLPISGRVNASLSSSFKLTGDLAGMLSSLRAKADIKVNGATITNAETKEEFKFDRVSLATEITRIRKTARPLSYTFVGSYRFDVTEHKHTYGLKIPIAEIVYTNAEGTFKMTENKANLSYKDAYNPQFLTESEGFLSFDLAKEEFSYTKFSGALSSLEYEGGIQYSSFSKPKVKGDIRLQTPSLKNVLNYLKLPIPALQDSTALSNFSLSFPFLLEDNEFSAEKVQVHLDNQTIDASIHYDLTRNKQAKVNISLKNCR